VPGGSAATRNGWLGALLAPAAGTSMTVATVATPTNRASEDNWDMTRSSFVGREGQHSLSRVGASRS
jgi:hypothetical protein